jgi:hypothetical protein
MQSYPFLKANLEVLQRENPSIHQWLLGQGRSLDEPVDAVIRNRRGYLDWRLPNGKGLFETLSPGDAYRQWRIPDPAETGTTLLVGCSLGYGLNYLLPKLPCSHQVLVLEPRADMLLACMGHTDYRPFLETRRLLFVPPIVEYLKQTVSRLILPCLFGKITLRTDLPSLQLSGEYASWTERCREALEDLRVGIYTIRLHQDKMIQNELHNYQRARAEGSLQGLRGKMQGGTAVLLGAGPSLGKFAPALAAKPEQALYAASLQVLPSLQRWGLKPHFCMAIDCDKSLLKTYDRLDRNWAGEIPLIYSTTVHPEVVTRYPGPTIPLWTQGGLASRVLEAQELVLDVGSDVAVALVNFLRWCGAGKILLVGQDFSWPGDRTHTEGHLSDGQGFRFDPRSHVKLKNRTGEMVFSAPPYLTALREMERVLGQSGLSVFDLNAGGLAIRGSESITWAELCERRLLNSDPALTSELTRALKGGLVRRDWDFPRPRSNGWGLFLDWARKRLDHLFRKMPADQMEVRSLLDRILEYLQKDPLQRPYFLNDVLNLAGLMYTARSYGPCELTRCGEILDRVKAKVQDIECNLSGGGDILVPPPGWAASGEENPGAEDPAMAYAQRA